LGRQQILLFMVIFCLSCAGGPKRKKFEDPTNGSPAHVVGGSIEFWSESRWDDDKPYKGSEQTTLAQPVSKITVYTQDSEEHTVMVSPNGSWTVTIRAQDEQGSVQGNGVLIEGSDKTVTVTPLGNGDLHHYGQTSADKYHVVKYHDPDDQRREHPGTVSVSGIANPISCPATGHAYKCNIGFDY
jgi:hypothetical protein